MHALFIKCPLTSHDPPPLAHAGTAQTGSDTTVASFVEMSKAVRMVQLSQMIANAGEGGRLTFADHHVAVC